MNARCCRHSLVVFTALALLLGAGRAVAAGGLTWHKDRDRVDADVKNYPLPRLLETIAVESGWNVFVEPSARYTSSTKFKDLPVQQALRMLLGDLNFAVVPQSNAPARLYVFQTSMASATQMVRSVAVRLDKTGPAKLIPNELIVRLKPGVKIDDIAAALGAKVLGKIDSLNAYRLQFGTADAASAARDALTSNSDVAAVDNNYQIDRPQTPQPLLASSAPPLTVQPKAPPANGQITIGLVDTAIQPLGNQLDSFVLKQVSVTGDTVAPSGEPTHATSMAETMLTAIQAVNTGGSAIKIAPFDVYGNNASTTTFDVALGVTMAVNAGANPINLSLGSQTDSPILHDVIQQARDQGVVFFGAAGNEPVTTPTYPAAYPEVTAVTAGNRTGQIADYANRGSFVSMIAPGTAVVYYDNQPYLVTGTSTATAFASGLAAGLSEAKSVPMTQAEKALRQSLAVPPGELGPPPAAPK